MRSAQTSRRVGVAALVAILVVAALVLLRDEPEPAVDGAAPHAVAATPAPPSDARTRAIEQSPRAIPAVEADVMTSRGDADAHASSHTITVLVDGEVRPGARVIGWPDIEAALADADPLYEGLTDARGRAEVPATRETIVWASDRDKGESGLRVLAQTTHLLLRSPRTIAGDVIDAGGRAVPGAGVHAEIPFDTRALRDRDRNGLARAPAPVVTDAEGRFEMRVPQAHQITLHARRGAERSRAATLDDAPAFFDRIELRFGALGVTGTLVGPDGAGLAAPMSASLLGAGSVLKTRSAGGRFRFEVEQAGVYAIDAQVDGLLLPRQATVRVDDERPTHDISLRMIPTATIAGDVVRDGAPADLLVRAHPYARAPGVEGVVAARASKEVRATDGRFVLDGLHPDVLYDLTVRDEVGRKVARAHGVRPGSGDVRVIVGAPTATLYVTVVDALTGGRLDEGAISVMERKASRSRDIDLLLAGVHGMGTLEKSSAVGARYDVVAWCTGYSAEQMDVIAQGETHVVVPLQRTTTLSVTLRDDSGAPLRDVATKLDRLSGPTLLEHLRHAVEAQGRTDAAGRVLYDDVMPGRHALIARLPEGSSRPAIVEVGTQPATIELVLERATAGDVRLRVEDAAGHPLPETLVSGARLPLPDEDVDVVMASTFQSIGAWTDASGWATLRDVEPGVWRLSVQGAGGFRVTETVALPAADEIVLVVPDDALLSVR